MAGMTLLMPDELLFQVLREIRLAQLVGRQSAVREVEGLSPRPDQHSWSENN